MVEFGLEAARVRARLQVDLLASGATMETHELIIGATAIAMEFQVATVNALDFQRIPGLRVQIWGK